MTTPDGAETLDQLTDLVRSHLDAACVLVTRLTEDRQFVIAHSGRPLPGWFMASTTLDYSICQHSVGMDFPLVIDDAFSHPLVRGNLTVTTLAVAAYLGAPVHTPAGEPSGSICALEFHQRRWTEEDVEFIIGAARIADRIIASAD